MKISGKCRNCRRQPAMVGFAVTIQTGEGTLLYTTDYQELCLGCFQEKLREVMEVSHNLGVEARHSC